MNNCFYVDPHLTEKDDERLKELKALVLGHGPSNTPAARQQLLSNEEFDIIIGCHDYCGMPPEFVAQYSSHTQVLDPFSVDLNDFEQKWNQDGKPMNFGRVKGNGLFEKCITQLTHQIDDKWNASLVTVNNVFPSTRMFSGMGAIHFVLMLGFRNITTLGHDYNLDYLRVEPKNIYEILFDLRMHYRFKIIPITSPDSVWAEAVARINNDNNSTLIAPKVRIAQTGTIDCTDPDNIDFNVRDSSTESAFKKKRSFTPSSSDFESPMTRSISIEGAELVKEYRKYYIHLNENNSPFIIEYAPFESNGAILFDKVKIRFLESARDMTPQFYNELIDNNLYELCFKLSGYFFDHEEYYDGIVLHADAIPSTYVNMACEYYSKYRNIVMLTHASTGFTIVHPTVVFRFKTCDVKQLMENPEVPKHVIENLDQLIFFQK